MLEPAAHGSRLLTTCSFPPQREVLRFHVTALLPSQTILGAIDVTSTEHFVRKTPRVHRLFCTTKKIVSEPRYL